MRYFHSFHYVVVWHWLYYNKNNGRVAFIGIIIHNHSVLSMSLFIDLTFRLPNREASSEQVSAMLPLQLQKDKGEKITAKDR